MVWSADLSVPNALLLVEALADELVADPDSAAALARMRRGLLDHRDDDDGDADVLRDLLQPGPKGLMDAVLLVAADVIVLHHDYDDLPSLDLLTGGA